VQMPHSLIPRSRSGHTLGAGGDSTGRGRGSCPQVTLRSHPALEYPHYPS
jgi:hypothetical protein